MKYVLTLLAICLSFHFASRVEAGEPLILEGNTSLNLPKNKLNPDTLGNALAPGKRKNSSVDAVVAPWQNPLSGDAKRRKAMLEALDKKNNWAFQSEEELLGLSALNGESLDSEALLDGDSEGSSSRSLAERVYYGNRKRNAPKPERQARDFGMKEKKDQALVDNKKELTGADLLAADALANPDYYQRNFENLFQSEDLMGANRGIDALTQLSERDVTAANMLGMGNLIPDQLTQGNPSSGRMAQFNQLLEEGGSRPAANLFGNTTGNGLTSSSLPAGPSFSDGSSLSISGSDPSLFNSPGGSSLGVLSSSLESLSTSRTMGIAPSGMGFAPSGLGNDTFRGTPSSPSPMRQQAPFFFEIPKRHF
jgi:hypothetical protein